MPGLHLLQTVALRSETGPPQGPLEFPRMEGSEMREPGSLLQEQSGSGS